MNDPDFGNFCLCVLLVSVPAMVAAGALVVWIFT